MPEGFLFMLDEVCGSINNYFPRTKVKGHFNFCCCGTELAFVAEGQYFRVKGSKFNDGIHLYPASDLTDEEFDGEVWALGIPREVQKLAEEIMNWQAENSKVLNSPYQSESFGGYSYSKASNNSNDGSKPLTWRKFFSKRLNRWRCL